MKQELQNKLFEKYPKFFENKNKGWSQTRICDGIICGDGWYSLIDNLCDYITRTVKNNNHLFPARPIAFQIKEKYGGLRFYIDWVKNEKCKSNVSDENKSYYQNQISGAISFTEYLSDTICEVCGKPGKNQTIERWSTTRCEEHNEALSL